MVLLRILEVLTHLQTTTNPRNYNVNYYELLTLLNNPDLSVDYERYRELFYQSILPGVYSYNIHTVEYVPIDVLTQLRSNLSYRFPGLLKATPATHTRIRARVQEYLTILSTCITTMLNTLFDPECYRIQLRYYDGLIYSSPTSYSRKSTFEPLNYEHFIYRKLADNTYHGTLLNFISGEHSSCTITADSSYVGQLRALHNYLFPELNI